MTAILGSITKRLGWGGLFGVWVLITGLNFFRLPVRYAPEVVPVRLERFPMPLVVRAAGNLEAKESVVVRAQFDGPITAKYYREGQRVEKGTQLLVMGRDRIRLERQQKQDALVNARTNLSKAVKDLRLQNMLYERQAVPYASVEEAQANLIKARQMLRSAEEDSRLNDRIWNSSNVVAPFSGTIVRDFVGDEKFMNAGKDLLVLADVSEYTMKARVDELEIKQVRIGQPAEIKVQIYPQQPLPAIVRDIGSQSEGSGVPEVSVTLVITDSKGLELRPKLTAEARITSGVTEPVLMVPLTAVSNEDGSPRVWVIDAMRKIHSRSVTLGRTNPDLAEITSGLKERELVCREAEPTFANGMRVVTRSSASKKSKSRTHALLPKPSTDPKPGDEPKPTRRPPGGY